MNQELNISHSIVSRGTEKYDNHGYMSISEEINKYKYILNVDHGIKKATLNTEYLKFKSTYTIENIAFSRFQLITALVYEKHKSKIVDNILILGLGNIGLSCLFYLLDKNYKNITIYVREVTEYMFNLLIIIKQKYKIDIEYITKLEKTLSYNTFIETTGSSIVLKNIFEGIGYNKNIIILSTPRNESYLISPLIINRKNLVVIGGHELNGIDKIYKNKILKKLLEKNSKKEYVKEFINIYKYSIKKLKQIKNKKSNFIELFKY